MEKQINFVTFVAMPVILKANQVSLTEHVEPRWRVRCVHGHSGYGEWQHTQEQAIEYIESGMSSYFLLHEELAVRLVVCQAAAGRKFLKAETDGESPALLLQLPSI